MGTLICLGLVAVCLSVASIYIIRVFIGKIK